MPYKRVRRSASRSGSYKSKFQTQGLGQVQRPSHHMFEQCYECLITGSAASANGTQVLAALPNQNWAAMLAPNTVFVPSAGGFGGTQLGQNLALGWTSVSANFRTFKVVRSEVDWTYMNASTTLPVEIVLTPMMCVSGVYQTVFTDLTQAQQRNAHYTNLQYNISGQTGSLKKLSVGVETKALFSEKYLDNTYEGVCAAAGVPVNYVGWHFLVRHLAGGTGSIVGNYEIVMRTYVEFSDPIMAAT